MPRSETYVSRFSGVWPDPWLRVYRAQLPRHDIERVGEPRGRGRGPWSRGRPGGGVWYQLPAAGVTTTRARRRRDAQRAGPGAASLRNARELRAGVREERVPVVQAAPRDVLWHGAVVVPQDVKRPPSNLVGGADDVAGVGQAEQEGRLSRPGPPFDFMTR